MEDVRLDESLEALGPVIEGEGIRALAFVPLVAGARLLGKFMLYYREPHFFTDEEVMLARTIGAQVAFAIDQHKARELLFASEQRLRGLIESAGVAVYTVDACGHITMFNDAAADLWGRRPEIGKDLWCGAWRLFTMDGTPMNLDVSPIAVAVRENRAVSGQEAILERPDGTRVNFVPYPTPLRDTAGNAIGAINVLVDISHQKRAQEALNEALRSKDDFLGQVSHELRNPLTQVIGYSDLLVRRRRALPEPTVDEVLHDLHSQALRVQRLVENMLMLSRFERGTLPNTEPHLLPRLIDSTVDEFRRRFPATTVKVRISGVLDPVETNPSTIDQVLWNLLTNAQKYGPNEGPIEVVGSCRDSWVEVRVLDCGPGVPEDDIPQLFQPYYRSTPVIGQAGLGLGLSVCKRLIEAQHGEMWANRRVSGGMEFGLRMPVLHVDELE